ncbi:hypothetical protein K469DRAFT_458159, partial [Zopfia rhizophila CBS 207.26]
MEPLSVTASIVGILAAAAKVVEILGPAISRLKEAQPSAKAICSEINNSITILSALQKLFDNPDVVPQTRKDLIQLDQLIATFTDGVLLYSELEALVLQLGTATDTWRSRIQWARKEKDFASLLLKMQYFKSSITAILNILQYNSDIEAARSQTELSSVIISMLESDRDLARRLTTTITTPIRYFDFERDLEASRVYRQATRDTVDFSFRSSAVGSHAWSTLSDVSLSDISTISVVGLPVYQKDITNSYHYQF